MKHQIWIRQGFCALAAAFVGVSAMNVAADAFDITTDSITDLIAAIADANGNEEVNTINLLPGAIYKITAVNNSVDGSNGLPSITSTLTINGNGATIERTSSTTRILHVGSGGDLTLNDLTIAGGASSLGGGILNNGGAVTLNGCTVSNNGGGGIVNTGNGTLNIFQSTISGNFAASGGGIAGLSGTITVQNSTIGGNFATSSGGGGGVYTTGGTTLTMINCTISGNFAFIGNGGGILNEDGNVSVINCTIYGNSAVEGAGIATGPAATTSLSNSIVAGSNNVNDIIGAYTDAGYNLVEDGSGLTESTSFSGDPIVGPLADNGGPTFTHALLPGSPAINAGDGAEGMTFEDQRGVPRPQGGGFDIGAFEVEVDSVNVEEATRDLSESVTLIELSLFDGPNNNANAGRRKSLANRLWDAANALAVDDVESALDSLLSALARVDGHDTPPDWMPPGPEQEALAAEISWLISQLF